jgi:hypothetical protein
MITEDYVSFETAKLLKEKGFDVPCMGRYSVRSKEFHLDSARLCNNGGLFECATPTLQMTMKWLREVHKLFITIEIKGDPRMESFIYYKWSVAKYSSCQIERVDNGLHTPEDYWYAKGEEDETYELSCEAAIKYCLENLI